MKPAIAREYVVVERRRLHLPAALFVGVMCFAAGFLSGDWTAEPRFAEREASIVKGLREARDHADKVRESLRKGCYDFTMKKKEM